MKIILESSNFNITSTVKNAPRIDGVFFTKIKETALPKNFEVTLNFIGKDRMRMLNKKFRNKDYATDVLSFPFDNKSGEIFINYDKCKSKAKEFDRSPINYLYFVFIHALIHLRGLDHGKEMDRLENKLQKKFGI